MIDIYNHLLVGAVDGPVIVEKSLNFLRQAQDNGITDIIVTSRHYSGDFINSQSEILTNMGN